MDSQDHKLLTLLASQSHGILDANEMLRISKLCEYCFIVGFLLGGLSSGRQAVVQFLAEHQHLLPLKKRTDYVMWVRNRNYRVMAGFGGGGILRGAQMAGIGAFFSLAKVGMSRARQRALAEDKLSWVDDLSAGVLSGCLFAIAGKGHRMYYLRRGAVLGGLFGCGLASLRIFHWRRESATIYSM